MKCSLEFGISEGIVEDQLVMSQAAFVIASFLNGERDAHEIQYELASQFQGQLIPEDQILSVVETLDKHGFLNSEKFHNIRLKIRTENTQLNRYVPPISAGKSYPGELAELKVFLKHNFCAKAAAEKFLK